MLSLHTEPPLDSPPARYILGPLSSTPSVGQRLEVGKPEVSGCGIVPDDLFRTADITPAQLTRAIVVRARLHSGFQSTSSSLIAGYRTVQLGNPVATKLAARRFAAWISPSPRADASPAVEHRLIEDLGEPGYRLLRPIPAQISEVGPATFEASFAAANIAMVGTDTDDAYQGLVAQVLDTFDGFAEAEPHLGRSAAEELRVLRTYVAKV